MPPDLAIATRRPCGQPSLFLHDAPPYFDQLENKYKVIAAFPWRPLHFLSSFHMRVSYDTEPILPTTEMATNGKSKSEKKRVLVVGAGAAGS